MNEYERYPDVVKVHDTKGPGGKMNIIGKAFEEMDIITSELSEAIKTLEARLVPVLCQSQSDVPANSDVKASGQGSPLLLNLREALRRVDKSITRINAITDRIEL